MVRFRWVQSMTTEVLKLVLKALLPVPLLRGIASWVNGIKRKTIDKWIADQENGNGKTKRR